MYVCMYVCMLYFAENKKVMAAAANPVREPCDIGVKLADLGNACWTVSYITLLLHYIIIASAPEYKKSTMLRVSLGLGWVAGSTPKLFTRDSIHCVPKNM